MEGFYPGTHVEKQPLNFFFNGTLISVVHLNYFTQNLRNKNATV